MNKIPWSKPLIDDKEIVIVLECFNADWLTMGPKVAQFEELMAKYLHVPYAIAVNNGTVALDLALKVLGIVPGDEVIVPAMTYFATAASVSYQYAVPVFVDIEPYSYNLDPEKIEAAITHKTKAIIFIDYGGNPADIQGLKTVAKKHGLVLLQDAAQSLGGRYFGTPLGAQTSVSTMSFHTAKVMTTVEGGMIFTHSDSLAREFRVLRNQGESGKYLHSHLGTNARMTDMSAAIGISQLEKLPYMLKERERVALRYDSIFDKEKGVEIIRCSRKNSKHAHFFYPILVPKRDAIAAHLKAKDIDTRIAYPVPLYEQELYKSGRAASRKAKCPVAETFTSKVLNLPIYPALTDEEVDLIAYTVLEAVVR